MTATSEIKCAMQKNHSRVGSSNDIDVIFHLLGSRRVEL